MSDDISMVCMTEVLKDRRLQLELVDWYIAVFNDTGKGEWGERWTVDSVTTKLFEQETMRPERTFVTMFRSEGVLAGVSIATSGSLEDALQASDLPPDRQTDAVLTEVHDDVRWVAGRCTVLFVKEMGIRRDFRGGLRRPLALLAVPIRHAIDAYGAKFGLFWTGRQTRLFPLMAGLDARLLHEFKDAADNVLMGEELEHAYRRCVMDEKEVLAILPKRLSMHLAPPPPLAIEEKRSDTRPAELVPESEQAFIAEQSQRCEGASHSDKYVVALKVVACAVPKRFTQAGAGGLDEINAFDLAEATGPYMGQTNVIPVSSFVGPKGELWGLTVARNGGDDAKLFEVSDASGRMIPVHDGTFLVDAAKELFGTREAPRFPPAPGTLCPSAIRKSFAEGPCVIYATCAIGIPEGERAGTMLLMEDTGSFARRDDAAMRRMTEGLRAACAQSVTVVAQNQGVRLSKVYVVHAQQLVDEESVGCGLVIAPYLRIARDAIPEGGIAALRTMWLTDWLDGL